MWVGGMYGVQEEEARQIALLEEAMRASPSLVSAFSDQLRDNISMRSFRGGHEPRRSFSTMDNHSHLVISSYICSHFLFSRLLNNNNNNNNNITTEGIKNK